jgi:hypothetical protein
MMMGDIIAIIDAVVWLAVVTRSEGGTGPMRTVGLGPVLGGQFGIYGLWWSCVSIPNEHDESQAIWRLEEGHLIGQGNLVPLYCLTAPRVPSLDVRQSCIQKCWTKRTGSANPLDVWCHLRGKERQAGL